MKATTIIIAAVLSLQVSVLFAENNETRPVVSNEAVSFNINALAPITPNEATFEDATESNAFAFNFSDLAPVTPVEADFNDNTEVPVNDFSALAPVTPAEADFE